VTEEIAETDSQPACLADGLTDDYEYWDGEPPEALRKDKGTLCVTYLHDIQVGRVSCLAQETPD
jgi:hypothetical protein